MKEFKKWHKAGCLRTNCNLYGIGVCGDCQGLGTKEDAWKAALEWILNSIEKGDAYHLTRKGMCILIRKELEEQE